MSLRLYPWRCSKALWTWFWEVHCRWPYLSRGPPEQISTTLCNPNKRQNVGWEGVIFTTIFQSHILAPQLSDSLSPWCLLIPGTLHTVALRVSNSRHNSLTSHKLHWSAMTGTGIPPDWYQPEIVSSPIALSHFFHLYFLLPLILLLLFHIIGEKNSCSETLVEFPLGKLGKWTDYSLVAGIRCGWNCLQLHSARCLSREEGEDWRILIL